MDFDSEFSSVREMDQEMAAGDRLVGLLRGSGKGGKGTSSSDIGDITVDGYSVFDNAFIRKNSSEGASGTVNLSEGSGTVKSPGASKQITSVLDKSVDTDSIGVNTTNPIAETDSIAGKTNHDTGDSIIQQLRNERKKLGLLKNKTDKGYSNGDSLKSGSKETLLKLSRNPGETDSIKSESKELLKLTITSKRRKSSHILENELGKSHKSDLNVTAIKALREERKRLGLIKDKNNKDGEIADNSVIENSVAKERTDDQISFKTKADEVSLSNKSLTNLNTDVSLRRKSLSKSFSSLRKNPRSSPASLPRAIKMNNPNQSSPLKTETMNTFNQKPPLAVKINDPSSIFVPKTDHETTKITSTKKPIKVNTSVNSSKLTAIEKESIVADKTNHSTNNQTTIKNAVLKPSSDNIPSKSKSSIDRNSNLVNKTSQSSMSNSAPSTVEELQAEFNESFSVDNKSNTQTKTESEKSYKKRSLDNESGEIFSHTPKKIKSNISKEANLKTDKVHMSQQTTPKLSHITAKSIPSLEDEESIFNPSAKTKRTNQPIRESFMDKLTKAGRESIEEKQKEVDLPDKQKIEPVSQTLEAPHENLSELKLFQEDVDKLKDVIIQQLIGKFNNLRESSLKEKYQEIYNLFEHTIRDNEGHSVLLVGPRNSGKSAMINSALDQLEQNYGNKVITIKLNAFIHTDDNLALREIAKQLDITLGMKRGTDITFETRSINETFSNILLKLDKNEEGEDKTSKVSIVFIIDEFDKFTNNSKQTLLYNLFDLCQTSSVPICVVGVSSKITVRESLEKRVRSRFSQRLIIINKPLTIEEFWNDAKLSLKLGDYGLSKLDNKKYGEAWNNYIENLYLDKSSNLFKLVFQTFDTTKNYKDFNLQCLCSINELSLSQPFFNDKQVSTYHTNQSVSHIQSIFCGLSQLEFFIAIAAARWIEKYDLTTLNFNLAYNEYVSMIKMFNQISTTNNSSNAFDNNIQTNFKIHQKIWSNKVMRNLWESLYKAGLLLDSPTNEGGHFINSNQPKSLILDDNRMVQLDIRLDELGVLIPDSDIFKRLTRL